MHPTTYALEDVSGEPIVGFFYEFELIKAEKGFKKHKRISKIYKRVKEGDRRQVQVGFKGHPQQDSIGIGSTNESWPSTEFHLVDHDKFC